MSTEQVTETQIQSPNKPRSSMRGFIYLAVIGLGALFILRSQSEGPSAVAWGADLPAALTEAKTEDRPVLLAFSSSGCIYCKRMEAEVFPQDAVLAAVADFVPVKVDAWKDEATAMRYGVDGLPTYFVLRSDGTPVLVADGYLPADDFLRFLQAGKAAAEKAAGS
ncbi:MAG: thioredoxin family protein [Phycisphaerales bacterium]|nr:thioredoxin family protein [Phycisphaerales bacterium]